MPDDLTPAPRKAMTPKEEELLATQFAMSNRIQRHLLLKAFEGKAYIAVNLTSFEDYCKVRLGLTHNARYLSDLVKAARFERAVLVDKQVDANSDASEVLSTALQNKQVDRSIQFSLRSMLEIARLPEEKWKPLVDTYRALRRDATFIPKNQVSDITKMVNAELKKDKEAEAKALPSTPEPPKKASPLSHPGVRGEVYDTEEGIDWEIDRGASRPESPFHEQREQESLREEQDGDFTGDIAEEGQSPTPEPGGPTEANVGPTSGIVAPDNAQEVIDRLKEVSVIAVSFVLTFLQVYDAGNQDAMLALYMDAKAFKRKYEL